MNKGQRKDDKFPKSIITLHRYFLCLGTNDQSKTRVWRQILAVAQQAYDLDLECSMGQCRNYEQNYCLGQSKAKF